MVRVHTGVAHHKRVKRLLKRAKGFRGQRSKNLRTAKATLLRAGAFAYAHRRTKKRNMRSLWIVRIGAASREHGLSYSRFMAAVLKSKVQLDRKALPSSRPRPKAFAGSSRRSSPTRPPPEAGSR
jgi:large subunit ribosomal protein L20